MTPGGETRLVPQDGQANHVCRRSDDTSGQAASPRGVQPIETKSDTPPGRQPSPAPRRPVPVDGLEFTGRLNGKGEIPFVLLYTMENPLPRLGLFRSQILRGRQRLNWVETPVVLDFRKAEKVALPAEARERADRSGLRRKPLQWPVRDDLEGLWAVAQNDEFGRLQAEVTEFGFYAFAIRAGAASITCPSTFTGIAAFLLAASPGLPLMRNCTKPPPERPPSPSRCNCSA